MNKKNELPVEVMKAIDDGFTVAFSFEEGFFRPVAGYGKNYAIKDVQKEPKPSMESNAIVYRLTTQDGTKGYAVTDWEEYP